MNKVAAYAAPKGADLLDHYEVKVRVPDGEWQHVPVYKVKVDMHHVREASMAAFDMEGTVEAEITFRREALREAVIRPLSKSTPYKVEADTIRLTLDGPRKLVIECNGDRFGNLHLFANPIEADAPSPEDPNVRVIRPGIHRLPDLLHEGEVIWYFAPGMHYIEETVLPVPSGQTVYIAGGAILVGSLVCDHAKDVHIRGRGFIYLADFHRFSAFRGVRIIFSENISIEGITVIDPPHYSIFIGKSRGISIRNFKSFSTRGWSDGIDIMSSERIDIEDIFMRNSDDCIAVYGSRWDFYGDTREVSVRNAILWADVAHPIMIGVHGDHHRNGDTIEDLRFENIDILEHHEPQPNYWGAMAINAGDRNTVRNVAFENIRVEAIELGQLFDIRVVHNADYNPVPGSRIENIVFRDVQYAGGTPHPSRIYGFDEERVVDGVVIDNLRIGDERVEGSGHPALDINGYARGVRIQ
ncbi:glycoside hydrolase family 28 protein [Paenibacillus soyae]|uniref:Glycoside hydrolase family 28 protein n=1 Tax=Paenibacillus soyae TaxID=2969249 RepID=A0A9X2N225_9BACL|nr:glycoside hydrolase family 28 protein [Paenibacillus soyae]MCR2807597.1 glycoside hydrolase family 28 protein [Paenibacillus soyae]